jgi:hypothetical protein
MGSSIELTYKGRQLSIRALVIAGDWQVWFYEGSQRIYLYAVLHLDGLDQARRDLEAEAIVVPTIRFWPEATAAPAAKSEGRTA